MYLLHTHTFNGPLSGTTWVSWYQKGKTKQDFTEARDGEWQWHQLGHMQVCTSLQTDNHASTPPLSFLQAGCPERMISFTTLKLEKVCSQLPKYSDSVVLPAFARCCCSSQYCMWSYAGTDGWMPYRFINLALHAMRAL